MTCQMLRYRQISIGVEEGVAGMIMPLMKRHERLMGEGWNNGGLAPGVKPIGRVRIQGVGQRPSANLVRGGHGALHLIVDNPLVDQSSSPFSEAFNFQPVPLLLED